MAQTILQIKKGLTDTFIASPVIQTLYDLDPSLSFDDQFSPVSLESILFDVDAIAINTLQKLYDAHRVDVLARIAALKPHSTRWYASKSLAYQHGQNLVPDQDYYDNSALSAAQIEAAKVVKYAAVIEVSKGLRIKLAGASNGDLTPLSASQLTGVRAYMQRIKDAGVRLYIDSTAADSLRLSLRIYYDPLILDANGARLDGTSATPVQDAVKNFLKTGMPFNGLFVASRLIDALQAVNGVVIPHLINAQARYGSLSYTSIEAQYQPDSGWLRLISPSDLTLDFQPHEPI